MKRAAVFLVLFASSAQAQLGSRTSLPIEVPDRPFLLVDAPRRFLPTESAQVRVQLREGGRARLSVFEVTDRSSLLGQAGQRQGVSVAASTIGAEAEGLIVGSGALPRRGAHLSLRMERDLEMPGARGARRVSNETSVYDSNEDEENGVATYWVADERWSVRRVDVGRLPTGLYLVQVRAAAWVGSALLSVGEIVMIARRGDRDDVVRVTDANGAPRAGVDVRSVNGTAPVAQGRTDAEGIVRLASSDATSVRFIAEAGNDLAWADVAHARLTRCDPRVYLATDRPVFRNDERVFARGHVRGCNASGAYVGLAGRTVRVSGGGESVDARTDRDGNFVARVKAGELTAVLDGRAHTRPLRVESGVLPHRDVIVTPDRPWAVAGETLVVRVADIDGGWPRPADVVLDTPLGRLVARAGPRRPAVFFVQVPSSVQSVERMTLNASLSDRGAVTFANAEIWIGRTATSLALEADSDRGESGHSFALRMIARHLSGRASAGDVDVEVFGSNGNEAVGIARHRRRVSVPANGQLALEVPLSGEGPWLVLARRGAASARMIVWERDRPPSLSARGPLALSAVTRARVGDQMAVQLRIPRGRGRGWLTLEQGGVVASVPLAQNARRATVTVPNEARGIASLVLAYVEGGRVSTATATVEVETSRPMSLSVTTDRPTYARGERAHVIMQGRNDAGQAHDAVISLWLADAGYWDMGEEEYPLPDAYLRLPGRRASGGDSSTPTTYGSEEGRVFESKLEWDGRRLPGTTHRHGWGYGGDVIHRLSARGPVSNVLSSLARAAGFARGTVRGCGRSDHQLVVHDLPWDLVVERVSEEVTATVSIQRDALVFDCLGGGGTGFGSGGGSGGGGGTGSGTIGLGTLARSERLEGTLYFVGLQRLGRDGRYELDVPLPDHPGRWRIEVLAIADDGGGARGHAVVHTRQPIETWVDIPRTVRPDDELHGAIVIDARTLAGRDVALRTSARGGRLSAVPASVRLDRNGEARVPITIDPVEVGTLEMVIEARAGSARDAIRSTIRVLPPWTQRALRTTALVGGNATDIEVPLPELTDPTTIAVELPSTIETDAARVLEALRQPRWDVPILRIDRLQSLVALWRAVRRGQSPRVQGAIGHAIDAELRALAGMRRSDDSFGGRGNLLTLEVLEVVHETGFADELWRPIDSDMREGMYAGRLHGVEAAMWVAMTNDERPPPAWREELPRILRASSNDPEALGYLARAARVSHAQDISRRASDRLVRWIETTTASPAPAECRGPIWFLCFARHGEHGRLARAALTLLALQHPRGRELAGRVVSWIAGRPIPTGWYVWGSPEADIVELIAALNAPSGADTWEARLDGRAVTASSGRITVPAGAHRLTLHFPARSGRARNVIARGDVRVAPPARALGNVQMERRISERDGRWEAVVRFVVPASARSIALRVPLPAGLTADHGQLGRIARTVIDGAVHIELASVSAGAREVRIPLLRVGAGTFEAAPAELTSDDGRFFGMTPAERVSVR